MFYAVAGLEASFAGGNTRVDGVTSTCTGWGIRRDVKLCWLCVSGRGDLM